MHENEITYKIRGAIFKVYNALGPGLLESSYEAALAYELINSGLNVRQQVGLPMVYEKLKMDVGYRIDLLVENKVIVEVKSVENLAEVHFKQLITYLRLSNLKVGLLVNFNSENISNSIHRKVNDFHEWGYFLEKWLLNEEKNFPQISAEKVADDRRLVLKIRVNQR